MSLALKPIALAKVDEIEQQPLAKMDVVVSRLLFSGFYIIITTPSSSKHDETQKPHKTLTLR